MAKKRAKIFETGNYPQGDYPIDRVKTIFENATESIGRFRHSTKTDKLIELGKVSNFEVTDAGVVYADIDLNDKGDSALDMGIIDGISVEIANDKLGDVAFLPVGTDPQVSEAHFDDGGVSKLTGLLEFETFEKIAIEDVSRISELDMAIDDDRRTFEAIQGKVWELSDEKWAIDQLAGDGYSIMKNEEFAKYEKKTADTKKTFSKEEIKAELDKEYQIKQTAKELFKEFEDKGIVTKASKDLGLSLELVEALVSESTEERVVEFADSKVKLGKIVLDILKESKGLRMESEIDKAEFKKEDDGISEETQTAINIANGIYK